MTCCVGVVGPDGTIYMGADSAGVAGLQVTVRKDAKIFRNGEFLIAFTSSFRMGQLLRHSFAPPAIPDGADLYQYMVTSFVDELRSCFKEGGYAREYNKEEQGGTFLVGVRGRLFEIEQDYQVGESYADHAAVGCGEQVALGALYATSELPPERRVQVALYAAQEKSGGVRAPFIYESLPRVETRPERMLPAAGGPGYSVPNNTPLELT